MNKDIETYLVSQFIDYKGQSHPFVICAISTSVESADNKIVVGSFNKKTGKAIATEDIKRIINLGYAICNPVDKFDEVIGRQLAKQRALTEGKQLFTTNPGIINHTMIEGLLKQEENFIKSNPGTFIKGYTAAKKKYKSTPKKKEYVVDEKSLRKIIDMLGNRNAGVNADTIIEKIFGNKN